MLDFRDNRPEDEFRRTLERRHREQGKRDVVGYVARRGDFLGVRVEWSDGQGIRRYEFHPYPVGVG